MSPDFTVQNQPDSPMNVLCICTAGEQRSPTAARLVRENYGHEARAAGVHPLAFQALTQRDIDWADVLLFMNEAEDRHHTIVSQNFSLGDKKAYVFDIPDIYPRDDPELAKILSGKLNEIFSNPATE
ncbi:MAG: protein tyrosine phosphatase [Candidatus Saccharibacteria bacterium]|nr:protein tyrosine phosphatase [Candidatus Saccharibacteria bacterium]